MTEKEASNITYKGYKSTTLHLVLLGFITGTALLIAGLIDAHVWETGILGSLTGYIVRDGLSKMAEVYYQKKIADMKPDAGEVRSVS